MLEFQEGPGNKAAFIQLNDLDNRTRRGIRQFWFGYGKTLLKSFNKSVLKKPRAGRVYKRKIKGGRRRHIASKPGESPANRSGNYRKSAGYQIRGEREMLFGVTAKYGGWLENGTKKMSPRPGLLNATLDTEGEGLRDAANILENELTRL